MDRKDRPAPLPGSSRAMNPQIPDVRIPLLGAALGDALGAGVEGGHALARAIEEDRDGVGRRFFPHSPFGFQPGELTDDTQMAWAAFVELRRGLPDVMVKNGQHQYVERVGGAYRAWYQSEPPDVGAATAGALSFDSIDGGWKSWAGGESAGNGSLMRATAPYVAGYRGEALLVAAALDSSITHPDPRCVASCVWYSATLEAAQEAEDPSRLMEAIKDGLKALHKADVLRWLAPLAEESPDSWAAFRSRWADAKAEVNRAIEKALAGHYIDCLQTPWEQWPTGFVMSTLPQSTWAALQGKRADEALRLAVVHGGRDADTIGAIAGGLIGARFGQEALSHWDARMLKELRLGHHWLYSGKEGALFELLGSSE